MAMADRWLRDFLHPDIAMVLIHWFHSAGVAVASAAAPTIKRVTQELEASQRISSWRTQIWKIS